MTYRTLACEKEESKRARSASRSNSLSAIGQRHFTGRRDRKYGQKQKDTNVKIVAFICLNHQPLLVGDDIRSSIY